MYNAIEKLKNQLFGSEPPLDEKLEQEKMNKLRKLVTELKEPFELCLSFEGSEKLNRIYIKQDVSFGNHGKWFDCEGLDKCNIKSTRLVAREFYNTNEDFIPEPKLTRYKTSMGLMFFPSHRYDLMEDEHGNVVNNGLHLSNTIKLGAIPDVNKNLIGVHNIKVPINGFQGGLKLDNFKLSKLLGNMVKLIPEDIKPIIVTTLLFVEDSKTIRELTHYDFHGYGSIITEAFIEVELD